MVNEESVKDNIRKVRLEMGLTQLEMSLNLGISRTSYRKLERQGTAVINPKVYKISELSGVPVSTIITGEEETSENLLREVADTQERIKAVREDYENRLSEKQAKIDELLATLSDKEYIIESQRKIISFLESRQG